MTKGITDDGTNGGTPAPVEGVYESRCKLCRMGKSHPELAEFAHELHFIDQAPYRDILAQVNRQIQIDNLPLEPLTLGNFTVHFRDHVPIDKVITHSLQAKTAKRKRPGQDGDFMGRIVEAKRENLEKMRTNVRRWQKVIDTIFAGMGLDAKTSTPPHVGADDVNSMRSATSSMAVLATAMDRYVKDHFFVLDVLDYAVDFYGRRLSSRLGEGIAQLFAEAERREESGEDLAEWYRERIPEVLTTSVDGLYDEVKAETIEKYGL